MQGVDRNAIILVHSLRSSPEPIGLLCGRVAWTATPLSLVLLLIPCKPPVRITFAMSYSKGMVLPPAPATTRGASTKLGMDP